MIRKSMNSVNLISYQWFPNNLVIGPKKWARSGIHSWSRTVCSVWFLLRGMYMYGCTKASLMLVGSCGGFSGFELAPSDWDDRAMHGLSSKQRSSSDSSSVEISDSALLMVSIVCLCDRFRILGKKLWSCWAGCSSDSFGGTISRGYSSRQEGAVGCLSYVVQYQWNIFCQERA